MTSPCDGVAAQIPFCWSAPGAAQEFPSLLLREQVTGAGSWDPHLLQRLQDDSVLAPGSESSVCFCPCRERRYQPSCCTPRAVPQSFHAKVHSRTVLFLDISMSERLAGGSRIWMEGIRQGSTPGLYSLGDLGFEHWRRFSLQSFGTEAPKKKSITPLRRLLREPNTL